MFHHRVRRRFHRFGGLGNAFDVPGVHGWGAHRWFGADAGWRPRRRRGPSWMTILLAGLAGLALAKLMSRGNRSDLSTGEKVLIGALVVAVAAFTMSLRRRAMRYW